MSKINYGVLEHQLDDIISLAERAGDTVLQLYPMDDMRIPIQTDGSLVPQADWIAHDVIVNGLRSLTPALPILSEESNSIPYDERRHWEVYWLVDPLDGTKEFIKGNCEFTMNIALILYGVPVLGVVYAPAKKLTYYAVRGKGTFRRHCGEKPVKVAVSNYCGENMKIVVSRSHSGEPIEKLMRRLRPCEYMVMGSSLKFCLVADGTVHAYPRLGPTMEWDTAAGQCIVEAAGGTMTDMRGRPLHYNKLNLLNPDFIASGTSSCVWWRCLNGQSEEGF